MPVSGSMSIVVERLVVPANTFATAVITTLVASNVILVSVALLGSTSNNIFCRISPAVTFGFSEVEISFSIVSSVSGIALANSGFFLASTNSCAKRSKGCDDSLLIVFF